MIPFQLKFMWSKTNNLTIKLRITLFAHLADHAKFVAGVNSLLDFNCTKRIINHIAISNYYQTCIQVGVKEPLSPNFLSANIES